MVGKPFIPESEINSRISRLKVKIKEASLNGAFVFEYVEMLYYTGTLQNGMLFVPAEGDPILFVRRSYDRAVIESPVKEISAYTSFKEINEMLSKKGLSIGKMGIDENSTTLSLFKMLKKYFMHTEFTDIGLMLRKIRSVKSKYEIKKIKKAGDVGRKISDLIPSLLVPGITEWELALRLFQETTAIANTCIARLMFNSGEFFLGNVCFGDNSLYPGAFDGPGGIVGKSPVCPYGGSDRSLKKGDLVFIDIGYPFEEYYSDKTRIFSLGIPDPVVVEAHAMCLNVQALIEKRLKPGAIPSDIYDEVYNTIIGPGNFDDNFMGFKSNKVKFLGHGIGMVVNEYPVIAKKFNDPLEENMVLAIEPKKGIEGIGMVGIENTFQVTAHGGHSLTQDNDEIFVV